MLTTLPHVYFTWHVAIKTYWLIIFGSAVSQRSSALVTCSARLLRRSCIASEHSPKDATDSTLSSELRRSFCKWILFDGKFNTSLNALWEKNGLLRLRSRPQLRFIISRIVCPDDILWIAGFCNQACHVYATLWAKMSCGRGPCHMVCNLEGQGHSEGSYIKVWLFPHNIFRTTDPFVRKPSLLIHHHKPQCLV